MRADRKSGKSRARKPFELRRRAGPVCRLIRRKPLMTEGIENGPVVHVVGEERVEIIARMRREGRVS